jgi:hypothetical protein
MSMESAKVLQNMKMDLENEGFTTSRNRPFFNRLRGDDLSQVPYGATEMYVSGMPVSPIAPFDFVDARVHVQGDRVYFGLTIYFSKVLDGLLEPHEFNEVFERHDTVWFPKIEAHFADIAIMFSLSWDTEYDSTIEDTLWAWYPVAEYERVSELLKAVKKPNSRLIVP